MNIRRHSVWSMQQSCGSEKTKVRKVRNIDSVDIIIK